MDFMRRQNLIKHAAERFVRDPKKGPSLCPTPPLLWLVLLLPLLGGCTFDRQWRQLVREQMSLPATQHSDPLAGRWEGTWVSDRSGHSGSLRAIIAPTGETTYHVDFDAMFFAVLRAGYSLELTTTPATNGATSFRGEKDLGRLAGGVYRYAGSADGRAFNATYESGADNGRFQMTRPKR